MIISQSDVICQDNRDAHFSENINFKLIRGNVDTRIKKLIDGLYYGIILSLIGLKFLGLEKNVSQIFSTSEMIPSVGQGVIAVQCRKDDLEIQIQNL